VAQAAGEAGLSSVGGLACERAEFAASVTVARAAAAERTGSNGRASPAIAAAQSSDGMVSTNGRLGPITAEVPMGGTPLVWARRNLGNVELSGSPTARIAISSASAVKAETVALFLERAAATGRRETSDLAETPQA
jgi:hypothetical protein